MKAANLVLASDTRQLLPRHDAYLYMYSAGASIDPDVTECVEVMTHAHIDYTSTNILHTLSATDALSHLLSGGVFVFVTANKRRYMQWKRFSMLRVQVGIVCRLARHALVMSDCVVALSTRHLDTPC